MLTLIALVAFAGKTSRSAGDWRSLALDHAAELPSAFAHPDTRSKDDVLLRPASPVTELVNRPRQGMTTYRVQEGDTVAAIADQQGISMQTILWANGLDDDELLQPGRQLTILPVSGVLHTVKPGEKLPDIAQRYQTDARAIIEFNQITDADQIVPNEVLVVPGGRQEERPRPMPVARGDARLDETEVLATVPSAISVPEALKVVEPSTYTVAQGDVLSKIAEKYGVSVETILSANGLDNPEFLKEGQKLTILPVSGALHQVAQGDTLLAIANRYGVASEQIVSTNGLSSADSLSVGQQLIVPGARLATAAEVAQARAAATQALFAGAPKHTVGAGDTLLGVANRYGVEATTIARANNLASADLLKIGQQLAIPGGRAIEVAAAPAPVPAAPKPAAASPPVQAAPPPPPAPDGDGSKVVSIASKYLGYAYTWGGHSPSTGFDCSGLVWYVYQQAGIRLPNHDLWGQLQAGPRISLANLQPGDIVFFQNTYKSGLSHNGIYVGGGRFINAEDYGKGVRVASINDAYWSSRFFGASRPW